MRQQIPCSELSVIWECPTDTVPEITQTSPSDGTRQFLIDVTPHISHFHILAHMGFESEQEQEVSTENGDGGLKEQKPCPRPWETSSKKRRDLMS